MISPLLVGRALHRLISHEPPGGYVGGFSGGKDSVVIKRLAEIAGVRIVWRYNVTSIDPPELIRFIKAHHKDVAWRFAKKPFFQRMPEKGIPTRQFRWCCEEYKECRPPKGSIFVAGTRAEESPRRAKAWGTFSKHKRSGTWTLSPILDWSEGEVWEFIADEGLPYCSLYDEDFSRLGCVGCPLSSTIAKKREFKRWPRYETLWKKALHELWLRRAGTKQRDGREWFGSALFADEGALWEWWIDNNRTLPKAEAGE